MSSVRCSLATAGKFAIAASRNTKLQHGKLLLLKINLSCEIWDLLDRIYPKKSSES